VFKVGVPRKLFVKNVVTVAVPGQPRRRNSYAVLHGDQTFLLEANFDVAANARSSATVVLNWTTALDK
jgi:hypothetical protein